MNFPDIFRAQYFLKSLEKEITRAEKTLSELSFFLKSLPETLKEFSSFLVIELDQLILPTIVFEIYKAKQKGFLRGDSVQDRYVSFFIDKESYSRQARIVLEFYPFLFELIDHLIRQTFDSLIISLKRFRKNQLKLAL